MNLGARLSAENQASIGVERFLASSRSGSEENLARLSLPVPVDSVQEGEARLSAQASPTTPAATEHPLFGFANGDVAPFALDDSVAPAPGAALAPAPAPASDDGMALNVDDLGDADADGDANMRSLPSYTNLAGLLDDDNGAVLAGGSY